MLQRMTRPQHTGTHIVEASSAAMSLLAGCEFRRIIHWNLLAKIRTTDGWRPSASVKREETEFPLGLVFRDDYFSQPDLMP